MTADDSQNRREQVLAALERYEEPLTRYAARLLGGDVNAAQDVVQHAFLQLCDRPSDQLNGSLAAWLYSVCRNKAFDLLRNNGREQSLDDSVLDDSSVDRFVQQSDPARSAEEAERDAALRSVVDQLPAAQGEALDLWAEGFTSRQIAEITNRSELAVRGLVHRALTRLRKHPRIRAMLEDETGCESNSSDQSDSKPGNSNGAGTPQKRGGGRWRRAADVKAI